MSSKENSPPSDRRSSPTASPVTKSNSAFPRPASIASVESAASSRKRTSFESSHSRHTSRHSTSDRHSLPTALPGPEDRVFPVRSFVSVDPSQTPFLSPTRVSSEHVDSFPGLGLPDAASKPAVKRKPQRGSALDGEPQPHSSSKDGRGSPDSSLMEADFSDTSNTIRGHKDKAPQSENNQAPKSRERYDPSRRRTSAAKQIFNPATSSTESLASAGFPPSIPAASDGNKDGYLVTARFKHIITKDGHCVITGRDGEKLQRCEDEPIHIPGAVQSFGMLIALEEEYEGKLVVRVVSENSQKIIGYEPHQLFALSSFTDILSEEQTDNLLDHIDFIRDEESDVASNGPEVFTLSMRCPTSSGRRKGVKLWCAMHVNPVAPNIVICEFELDDDEENPPMPPDVGDDPEDTLNSAPTAEELIESTHTISKPLRVLRSARRRKGEAAAMEVFNIMTQVQEQLAAAPNLELFLKILVGVVKELTGFHRVMIYQFDSSYNGRVVTELVDPRATKDLYKGLNFPASDIPKQARELYKINKVRLLYDRDLPTARLVCRTTQDLEKPLDLTYSFLRAMSPIHIKYLANMAVRSSMSISINAFGELWGLISLHGYGPHGMRVSFPIRKMCRLVGDTASRNIERLSYASRLQARKLINTAPTDSNPSGHIIASSDDLLKLFDADFGFLSIRGEMKILGKPGQSQELLALAEYLRLRHFSALVSSDNLKVDFPDAPTAYIRTIAGLLLIPLSIEGGDFIVFFRRGQEKEVKWAGNPYEKFIAEGTEGFLEPRKSFKTWTERVMGKCREWTEEQIETAAVLCLVYGKFIEVWRQKEAALQNSQLTKLLLSNQAHEVRTPLNAIINYLEIALEGQLDQETRDNLAKSHSASKSLIYVINDLLDLTKTEEGQALVKSEVFDLRETIAEATAPFKVDAKRKNIQLEVREHEGVPQLVHGDQRRIRQTVANITANAIQHTTTGCVHVETQVAGRDDHRVLVDIIIEDTGTGMSEEKLDNIFRDLEQVSMAGDEEILGVAAGDSSSPDKTLGLGLATVARIVRNCGGTLRVKSKEGEGSRFVCQIPFDIPAHVKGDNESAGASSSSFIAALDSADKTLVEGEMMLVDRPPSIKTEGLGQKNPGDVNSIQSLKSNHSHHSHKSTSSGHSHGSHRSDMDRLIDAISEPLPVGRDGSQLTDTKRPFGSFCLSAEMKSLPSSSPSSERPTPPNRSMSSAFNVPDYKRSAKAGPPGTEYVQDSKTLLRAIRMPDEFSERPPSMTRPMIDLSGTVEAIPIGEPRQLEASALQVLIAEDDPINSRIIMKRLDKLGHSCRHTVNGEDCATAYGEQPENFDVILMDMQMPLVDGLTSTKMIRSHEKSQSTPKLSPRAALNTRIPIFAVSASLIESERQIYVSAGFDGWILKPIDFKRLNVLLAGIVSEEVRNECLYEPGGWEKGGWFERRLQVRERVVESRGDEGKGKEGKGKGKVVSGSDGGGGMKIEEVKDGDGKSTAVVETEEGKEGGSRNDEAVSGSVTPTPPARPTSTPPTSPPPPASTEETKAKEEGAKAEGSLTAGGEAEVAAVTQEDSSDAKDEAN